MNTTKIYIGAGIIATVVAMGLAGHYLWRRPKTSQPDISINVQTHRYHTSSKCNYNQMATDDGESVHLDLTVRCMCDIESDGNKYSDAFDIKSNKILPTGTKSPDINCDDVCGGMCDAMYERVKSGRAPLDITYGCMNAREFTRTHNGAASTEYFAQCVCFAGHNSDGQPAWIDLDTVDHLRFNGKTPDIATRACDAECETLCNTEVRKWLALHPEYEPAQRNSDKVTHE